MSPNQLAQIRARLAGVADGTVEQRGVIRPTAAPVGVAATPVTTMSVEEAISTKAVAAKPVRITRHIPAAPQTKGRGAPVRSTSAKAAAARARKAKSRSKGTP